MLLTTVDSVARAALISQAKGDGVAEISVPRQVMIVAEIPVLGTGKIDYVAAQTLAEVS